jgi:formylglycine-generating enzyme required for sulfatase activity/serine/threonine protein kinase
MIFQPGAILHNRYRIVKLLGQGGFGTMYRAWDTTLGRPCALKENLDAAPEIQRQFLREAKILANLNHPNLPRVTDYFIEGQGQYLVMDYIEGQDLQEMLEARGAPLPEDQVLPWIRQICDALTYLHAQKPPIIHRDVKPANIRITPAGSAILVDFGIAKAYEPGSKTTRGAQAVTPGFSPYEQYGKGDTDARTDVYALGATLYTLLTGTEPPESMQRVPSVLTPGRDPLALPRQRNPAISLRASAALMGALQMDPGQRLQSAADFKAALGPAPPPARLAASPPAHIQPSLPARSEFPWGWVAAVGSISLIVLILVLAILRGSPRPQVPSDQATHALPPASPALSEALPAPVETLPLTATLQLSPTPETYIVNAGDTCSEIAQTFGVSVSAIVALNDLPADCGVIYPGQALLIPQSSAGVQETTTPAATPVPVTPVATQVSPVDGMTLVYIPSGQFLMGSLETDAKAGIEEKPQRSVYLSVYWIDQTEVTNAMYTRCVREGACPPPKETRSKTRPAYYDEPAFGNYPVIYVSWQDADAYCRWAGRRLPSEAEWEKAARGSDGRTYPWGEIPPGPGLANFNNQVGDTRMVGSYPSGASPYGALDMAGNVAEWVADWYDADYYPIAPDSNPTGPEDGEFRVLRGGSWYNLARAMRAAFRLSNYPDLQSDAVGFRCAH